LYTDFSGILNCNTFSVVLSLINDNSKMCCSVRAKKAIAQATRKQAYFKFGGEFFKQKFCRKQQQRQKKSFTGLTPGALSIVCASEFYRVFEN
jgi:hypothetical protein